MLQYGSQYNQCLSTEKHKQYLHCLPSQFLSNSTLVADHQELWLPWEIAAWQTEGSKQQEQRNWEANGCPSFIHKKNNEGKKKKKARDGVCCGVSRCEKIRKFPQLTSRAKFRQKEFYFLFVNIGSSQNHLLVAMSARTSSVFCLPLFCCLGSSFIPE